MLVLDLVLSNDQTYNGNTMNTKSGNNKLINPVANDATTKHNPKIPKTRLNGELAFAKFSFLLGVICAKAQFNYSRHRFTVYLPMSKAYLADHLKEAFGGSKFLHKQVGRITRMTWCLCSVKDFINLRQIVLKIKEALPELESIDTLLDFLNHVMGVKPAVLDTDLVDTKSFDFAGSFNQTIDSSTKED